MIVVDIFAGAGGFSLGFREAGFRVALAVDVDYDAVRTYSHNFPDAVVLEADVREVDHLAVRRYVGDVDVLIGSPPCEPFTGANPNRLEEPADRLYLDPAGQLTLHFIRLLGELKPKAFVMENVAEIAKPPIRDLLEREFRQAGYEPHFNVVLAELHGVPSHRRRAFVSNVRLRLPRAGLVTVRQALSGLPPPGGGVPNHEEAPLGGKAARAASLRPGEALTRFRGAGGLYGNYIRLRWDKPAPTVMGSRRFIHPEEPRLLTVREQARLMGFPDWYVFLGPRDSQYNQVGEAVPPPLSRLIATEVKKYIEEGV